MSTIDQFESVFRSAVKEVYQPSSFPIREILLINSQGDEDQSPLSEIESFLSGLTSAPKVTALPYTDDMNSTGLIEQVKSYNPDLIVTFRNLFEHGEALQYALGDHIEVLTQVTHIPLLLLPHPSVKGDRRLETPRRVMVLTDQLLEHPRLIDVALEMIQSPGELTVAHVEDETVFERYMGLIAKIPQIDTEVARQLILDQMLGEVRGYIDQLGDTLAKQDLSVMVHSEVTMGHQLSSYRDLVKDNQIELVVMQSKDDDQIAMHGLSYPLAVELRQTPLLMI